MTDYQRILMLCRSGMGTNPIARALGYKWETVERTLSKCEEIWGTIHEVPEDLSNEELGNASLPTRLLQVSSKQMILNIHLKICLRNNKRRCSDG